MVRLEETMNQLFRFGIILGTICLVATLVLAVTYEVTKPKIDEQSRLEEDLALKQILPEADSFSKKTLDEINYFEASKGNNRIGYCIKATGIGYAGYIRLIVGIDLNGIIKGVRILEHQETPGLGAKINEMKPDEADPWFLKQFIGRPAKTVALKKDVDAITGATISSKAVTEAINKTVNEFLLTVKR